MVRCSALAAKFNEPVTAFIDPTEEDSPVALGWADYVMVENSPQSIEKALTWLKRDEGNCLLLDSYAINEKDIGRAASVGVIAVFRDGPPYGPEQISIDVNPSTQTRSGIFAGPAYIPLPDAFKEFHDEASNRKMKHTSEVGVLVAFGQRDSVNHTCMTVEGLLEQKIPAQITIALGSQYEHQSELNEMIADRDGIDVWHARDGLATQYGQFDLAVGGPGVSQFERACCGLPTILVSQNAKHDLLVSSWGETGCALRSDPTVEAIGGAVQLLIDNPERRMEMRARGLAIVDGKGAKRLATALSERAEIG